MGHSTAFVRLFELDSNGVGPQGDSGASRELVLARLGTGRTGLRSALVAYEPV